MKYWVTTSQTSFNCSSDAVTAKSFTCYPQLTRHPAVCYTIAASPALSGTINLPSPFSPITDQHWSTAALDLPLLPPRKWKASSIICQGRVERPRLPFCKLVTSTTWRYHLKCLDLCHEGSCLSVLKSHFKCTSSCRQWSRQQQGRCVYCSFTCEPSSIPMLIFPVIYYRCSFDWWRSFQSHKCISQCYFEFLFTTPGWTWQHHYHAWGSWI